MKKLKLIEDSDQSTSQAKFKINKAFEGKFNAKKKRENLERAKKELSKKEIKNILEHSDESSASSDEDEDGELINDHVQEKFLKTLAKIRLKDHDIYDEDKKFFKDKDFKEIAHKEKQNKSDNKLTYKDMIRQQVLENDFDEEIDKVEDRGETIVEEQKRLKDEFKNAMSKKSSKIEEENLFTVKKKTKKEENSSKSNYENFLKNQPKSKDNEILERFWGNETQLDETDKFLKNYILSKGWIDKDLDYQQQDFHDEDDEQFEQQNDIYEEKYNFRYEEPGADQIITYERNQGDTLRQKNEKRKDQRLRKTERKEQEKINLKQAIKEEQKSKQKLIINKVKQASGTNKQTFNEQQLNKFLESDFNEQDYQKLINQTFNDDYYEQEDDNYDELKDYMKKLEKIKEGDTEEDQGKKSKQINKATKMDEELGEDKQNVEIVKPSIPLGLKKQLNKNELKAVQNEGTSFWWYCDGCQKLLQEYELKFDCMECPDYTLCKKCKDDQVHPQHKMKKGFVPQGCKPPEEELAQEILAKFKYCKKCQQKLFEGQDNYYSYKTKHDEITLCEPCWENEKFEVREKYQKIEGTEKDLLNIAQNNLLDLQENIEDEEIKNLVDEYYNLNFEDIIAGGIKTRFKYIDVEKEDYGLNDDVLQYCDEKLLNDYLSIKKLAPYRSDLGKANEKILKKKRPYLEKNAKQNKKKVKKTLKYIERLQQQLKQFEQNPNKSPEEIQELKDKIKDLSEMKHIRGKKQIDIDLKIKDAKKININADIKEQQKKTKLSSSRLKAYGIQ